MNGIINQASDSIAAIKDPKLKLKTLLGEIFSAMIIEEYQLFYQLNFQLQVEPYTRNLLSQNIEQRLKLMVEQIEPILSELKEKDSYIQTRALISEIDGIAMSYVFDPKHYPIDKVKKVFIKNYLKRFD